MSKELCGGLLVFVLTAFICDLNAKVVPPPSLHPLFRLLIHSYAKGLQVPPGPVDANGSSMTCRIPGMLLKICPHTVGFVVCVDALRN